MALRIPSGTSVGAPLLGDVQSATLRQTVRGMGFRNHPRIWFETFSEFDTATLNAPYTVRTATTAGTPTFAIVANAVNGIYRATLAANSEAETAGFDWGDSLMINKPDAGAANVNAVSVPVFQAYVRFPTALAANQTAVIGLGTAFNATLTSISKYAWFRLSGNMNVLMESKDGTTTNSLVAPTAQTFTLTANQFYLFTIDWTYLDVVRFFLDDTQLGTLNMAAIAATDKVQPMAYLQKSTGATTPTMDVDMCQTVGWRY